MKTVWLLRHAKSSWDDSSLPDHERPLAPRGQKAAKRIRAVASGSGVRPELVLCSTAARARATLERVLPGLGSPAVELQEGLYLASADDLLARLRGLDDALGSVMIVGHNPGLHELARLLAPPGPEAFPTGALAELRLGVSTWSSASADCAELARLVLPRTLR